MAVKNYAMLEDGLIVNVIAMDPLIAVQNDMIWDGKAIVQIPDGMPYGIGHSYSVQGGFVIPPEEVVVEVPEIISDRQFFQQLAIMEMITQEEALAAVQVGALPSSFETLLTNVIPEDQQFGARMLLTGATEFKRDHPVVGVFAAASGWSDAQTDAFWINASQL